MSSAADRRLAASPRRHVRWTYLREAWPDCPAEYDAEHVLNAPEDAIIAAVVRDATRYGELLSTARLERAVAQTELKKLEDAVGLVLGLAARLATPLVARNDQLTLDDMGIGRTP